MFSFLDGLIFILGAIIGSFLNVCIYRLPRRESIIRPGSYCPSCKRSIPFLHNIPILGYLLLAGKCRNCKVRIPYTYPVVEFLTGILLVLVWRHYGPSPFFIHYSILMLLLVPISFIDLDFKLILNVLTFPGIVIGLLLSVVVNNFTTYEALIGLSLGGGFLWLIGVLGKMAFKQESMGGGDIKLGAMIGVFLGPKVIIVLFLAFFLALPVVAIGLGTKRLRVGSTLPFGPFISLGTVIIVCFGQQIWTQYLRLFN